MAAKVVIALKKFWTRIVSSANEFPSQLATVTKLGMSISEIQRRNFGDETLRPQDTSAPRHFGIGAEVSSDTSAPVPKCLETLRTSGENRLFKTISIFALQFQID